MRLKHLLLALVTTALPSANALSQTLELNLRETLEKAKVEFSMVATNLDSKNNKSSVLNSSLGLSTTVKIASELKANFDGEFVFGTGSSNSVYENNRVTEYNGTNLKDAYLSYNFKDLIILKAGAINQKAQQAPLVVGTKSFLALSEEINVTFSEVQISFGATQAKPKSTSNKDGIGEVDEGSPLFAREYIRAKSENDSLTLQATVGHFAYDKLSADAAYNSQFYGNSVMGQTKTSAEYIYSFVGWDFELETKFHLTKNYDLIGEFHHTLNTAAPTGKNRSQAILAGLSYERGNWKTTLAHALIRIESNATPAIYLNSSFENNYNTQVSTLGFENSQSDLSVKLKYRRATPIDFNFYQEKTQTIELELRKGYEIF